MRFLLKCSSSAAIQQTAALHHLSKSLLHCLCRCCQPIRYLEGAQWTTQPVALLTASQLMDVAQRQQNSIGCCVVAVSAGEIRCDVHSGRGACVVCCIRMLLSNTFGGCSCIASTLDTTTTQHALAISFSCVQQRSAQTVGSNHWTFSCPVVMDERTFNSLLDNLPPVQRSASRQQLPKAGR